MSRRRLALILGIPTLLIVLAIGLTRDRDTNEGSTEQPSTTLAATTGDEAADAAVLEVVDEPIQVPAGSDCSATTTVESPACQAVQVLDTEVAWLVEQQTAAPPVASFLRRRSDTEWVRVLTADGATGSFDRVNVRLEDISGDGGVEAIFAFHLDNEIRLDVVEASGHVALHVDLGVGQALVQGGQLVLYLPDGADWRRQTLRLADGEVVVVEDAVVDGPAQGNI